MRRLTNFIFGVLIGAFVGATTAILLAQSSGNDFQLEIRDRFKQLWDELQDAAQDRRAELEDQLAEMRRPD
jgi:gas vesicle protein